MWYEFLNVLKNWNGCASLKSHYYYLGFRTSFSIELLRSAWFKTGRLTDISDIPTADDVDECLVEVEASPEAPKTGVEDPLTLV